MLSAYFRGTRSFVRHDGEHLNQEVNRAAETWQASIVLEGVQAPWEENRPATSCAEICWGLSGSRFRTLLDHLLSCPNEILNHIVDGSIETVFTLNMENCFELQWCEESHRYIIVPESDGDAHTRSAPTVRLASSAVADAPRLGCTIGVPLYSRTENLWYPGSQTVEVQGYRIPGMVYTGTTLRAMKGEGIEPALITPI